MEICFNNLYYETVRGDVMFFNKLLNMIPFFRKRNVKKIRKELADIKNDFADGFFNDKFIISLHNILNTGLIDFSGDLVDDSLNKITTYSKTSYNALALINKGDFKKTTLERSKLMYMNGETHYFSNWYSNEDSVNELISAMRRALQIHACQIKGLDMNSHEFIGQYVSESDLEFIESLLYRLLLIDVVSLSIFYLESKYD